MKLNVVKIQRFSTHDGPGVRTVVFAKGCPLRCRWCHNPETQSPLSQIFYTQSHCILCGSCAVCPTGAHAFSEQKGHAFSPDLCTGCQACADVCPTGAIEKTGKAEDVETILQTVLKDRVFYGSDGGLTLSGGEPMAQPKAAIALLKKAKENGISTAIETCGQFDPTFLPELTEVTDLFLWDFKDGVSERHKEYTGVGNERIIENLLAADASAKHILLRCILVKGVNTDSLHLEKISEIYHRLCRCDGIELLPYHAYGGSKQVQLGNQDNGNPAWIPSQQDLDEFRTALTDRGCKVYQN